MRILHVVPTLGYGGVAKVVTNYYEQLDHKKYIFDIVTHGGVENYHQDLIDDGSKIYYFHTLGKVGVKKYIQQIKENIDLDRYDIVHLHVGHILGLYAWMFHLCGAKNIICHAHTTRCMNPKHRLFMPLFRVLTAHYSKALIACGHDAGKYCFGKHTFMVLPNGISFEKINRISSEEIQKVKKEFHLQDACQIIGHVGAFVSQKNHQFILEIIRDYIRVHPDAVFVLVGDGELKQTFEKKSLDYGLTQNMIFTGIRSDVYTLMHMFDVFILPSLHEGLPVVGIEAQAAGTRCIFSNTVDATVDIGAGFTEFLPIDSGTRCWVDELDECYDEHNSVDMENVQKCLNRSGYEISVTAKQLQSTYNQIVSGHSLRKVK